MTMELPIGGLLELLVITTAWKQLELQLIQQELKLIVLVTEVVVVGSSDEVFARVPAVLGGSVGAPVTLDATHSFGLAGRPLSYAWKQVGGPPGRLASSRSGLATFTPDALGEAVLEVSVSNAEGASSTARVAVRVGAPTAQIAASASVKVGEVVTLDGTRSFDPQGDTLSFAWRQVGGTPVVLTGASTARPSFRALRPGLLRFALAVSDATAASGEVIVEVQVTTANNAPPVAIASNAMGQPGVPVVVSAARRCRQISS
jgi:hypothetical protein